MIMLLGSTKANGHHGTRGGFAAAETRKGTGDLRHHRAC